MVRRKQGRKWLNQLGCKVIFIATSWSFFESLKMWTFEESRYDQLASLLRKSFGDSRVLQDDYKLLSTAYSRSSSPACPAGASCTFPLLDFALTAAPQVDSLPSRPLSMLNSRFPREIGCRGLVWEYFLCWECPPPLPLSCHALSLLLLAAFNFISRT